MDSWVHHHAGGLPTGAPRPVYGNTHARAHGHLWHQPVAPGAGTGTWWPTPARTTAIAIIGILGIGVFHPTAATPIAALAQIGLYLAILAPLFWVPRLTVGVQTLHILLAILWGFASVGSGLGVVRVYFPGSFQPSISPVILAMNHGYLQSLMITTSSGVRVLRPMGLTDVPGGAASSGFYAVLLGIGFFLTTKRTWLLVPALGSVLLGMMCLYLSQVRSLLVMTAISVIAVTAVLALRRDYKRLGGFGVVLVFLVIVSFRSAVSLAQGSVEKRVGSLAAGTPGEVYGRNRGQFLSEAFNDLLPRYPLGAGVGRWGMMNSYFGNHANPNEGIWAEIQWTGWVLDGGFPLILAYVGCLLITMWTTLRIARWRGGRDPTLSLWAAVIAGYSIGTLALTFSYPVFLSQTGMEFWLLSTVLYAAARTQAWQDMKSRAADRVTPYVLVSGDFVRTGGMRMSQTFRWRIISGVLAAPRCTWWHIVPHQACSRCRM